MKTIPLVPPDANAPADTTNSEGAAIVPDAERTAALRDQIVAAISTVYDPEIPVDAAGVAGIRMTLTAPGCPAAQSLPGEVAEKVKSVPGVTDARVDVVWEPAWSKDLMSEAARLQLGLW
jgi:metal-sulfur cluster biosynthetic enzyme